MGSEATTAFERLRGIADNPHAELDNLPDTQKFEQRTPAHDPGAEGELANFRDNIERLLTHMQRHDPKNIILSMCRKLFNEVYETAPDVLGFGYSQIMEEAYGRPFNEVEKVHRYGKFYEREWYMDVLKDLRREADHVLAIRLDILHTSGSQISAALAKPYGMDHHP